MTGRQRLLAAIENRKPDRLPVQVHSWMPYYLNRYLSGDDQFAAYQRFGMDMVIYMGPAYTFAEQDLANWREEVHDLGPDADGNRQWAHTITTPEGVLAWRRAGNDITTWTTEHPFKSKADAELFIRYQPVPIAADWSGVIECRRRIGDRGIIRCGPFCFGQPSPWQSLCTWMNTEEAILEAVDDPQWVHRVLRAMLEKQLATFLLPGWENVDLVETGGGAGSNTVISPKLHREFCLPYDQALHEAIHQAGTRVVYHLCGGLMQMLDLVVENGADGLETMTPPSMGGDCDLAEASRRVGDRLFFVGGFDQNAGFERGTPDAARRLVRECFQATCDKPGGYICSPSDHFFFGDPENVQAFADEAARCRY